MSSNNLNQFVPSAPKEAMDAVRALDGFIEINGKPVELSASDAPLRNNVHFAIAGSQRVLHSEAVMISEKIISDLCLPDGVKTYLLLLSILRSFFREGHSGFGWIYATSARRSHTHRHLESPGLSIQQYSGSELQYLSRGRNSKETLSVGYGLKLPPDVSKMMKFAASANSVGGRPRLALTRIPRSMLTSCATRFSYFESWTAVVRSNTDEEQMLMRGGLPLVEDVGHLPNGLHPYPIIALNCVDEDYWQTQLGVEFCKDSSEVVSLRTVYKPWWADHLSSRAPAGLMEQVFTKVVK